MGTNANALTQTADTTRNAGEMTELLRMLGPGDFLSISCQYHAVTEFAACRKHPGAMVIGFDSTTATISMSMLRDMLFAGAAAGKKLAIVDMSCFAGYFSEENVLEALERERDLEAMSVGLKMAIVAVHDNEQVDPHVAMTQPFIYDGAKLARNHFGVPVRHLMRRLESVGDISWFHAFNERSTQLHLA